MAGDVSVAAELQAAEFVMRRGRRLIAGFMLSRDAQAFASLKTESGETVVVKCGGPDSPYRWEVHALVREL